MATKRPPTRKPAKAARTVRPPTLYKRVQGILEQARDTAARSVNTAQVVSNWLIGREIVEEEQRGNAKAAYGDKLLVALSAKLTKHYGDGFSATNLRLFRQFFLIYPQLLAQAIHHAVRDRSDAAAERPIHHALRDEFGSRSTTKGSMISDAPRRRSAKASPVWVPGQLNTGLSWTHYRTLLRVEDNGARSFYEIEAVSNAWSARELERQINSLLFERLARSKDKKGVLRMAKKGHEITGPADVFKDPMVIEFLGIPRNKRVHESDMESLLINNLQDFLLELGKGFALVSRQERLTLEGDHFYIDLVFYHTVLKCYILIDLKVGKLTHADLGQIVGWHEAPRSGCTMVSNSLWNARSCPLIQRCS